MSSRFQVRKSRRERWPYCQPEYTVNGSFAGICTHMPSPPFTGYQSSSVLPRLAPVAGGVHAAVVADDQVARVRRVDPEGVIVAVHEVQRIGGEALAAVLALEQ